MCFYRTLILPGLILGMLFLSAGATKQQQLLFKQSVPVVDSIQGKNTNIGHGTSDYRIRSQDILQLRNLQSTKYIVDEAPASATSAGATASQGQTFQVEDDGTVALPVIDHE